MGREVWCVQDNQALAAAVARMTPDELLAEAVHREAVGYFRAAGLLLDRALKADEAQREA